MKRLFTMAALVVLMGCQGGAPAEQAAATAVETAQQRVAQAMKQASEAGKLVMVDLYTET